MSALAIGGMQIFTTQSKGQKTVEANYEVASVLQQILTILSRPDNCTRSLQGILPDGGEVSLLKKEVGAVFENVYALNTQLPGNIRITGYSLSKNFPGLSSDETILKINFSRGKAAIKDEIPKMIKIVYTLNASSTILSCYAYNNNNDSFWIQSLIRPEDIYYMVGNVGIGTADPKGVLDLVSPDNTNNLILSKAGMTSQFKLKLSNDAGIENLHIGSIAADDALSINSLGEVGIGSNAPKAKLDVNGSIKVGSTTSTCDPTHEGEIKYNFTTHKLEFCNGAAWMSASGFSTCVTRTAFQDTGYHSVISVQCLPDETVIGGTGSCASGGGANFTNDSHPDGNGWKQDCWHAMSPGYVTSKATVYAFCCK